MDGDFSVETSIVSGTTAHDYWAAQLFVRKDSVNWFGCGLTLALSGYKATTRLVSATSGSDIQSIASPSSGYYKITRVGNLLTGYYRTSGTTWIGIGSASPSWLNGQLEVGIYVKDTSVTNSYAAFDYVHFSTTRSGAATGIYLSRTVDLGVAPTAAGSIAWVQSVPLGAFLGIQTRTSPDGIGWSNWTAPYSTPGGSPISSPLARFIQFSATLTENGSLQSPQLDSVTITFPGIAPKSPVVISTEYVDSVWGNSKAVGVTWTEPVDTPAPVWAYYYSVDLPVMSGTAVVSSAMILSKTVSGIPLSLGDGIHTFSLLAQGDPLEYPNSSPTIFTIKKDTLPPDPVTISSATHPTAAANANDSPMFDLSASDSISATDLVSDIAGYVYVLDTVATSIPTASSTFTASNSVAYTGLSDGFWYFHSRAKDAAGNIGGVAHYQINISYKGRVTVTISSSTHPENQESASNQPQFTLAVANPDSATLIGFHYVLDASPSTVPTLTDAFTKASALSFTGLRNQGWYLHVSVKNALGSLSLPAHYGFKVNYQGHILDEAKVHAVPHPIRGTTAVLRYELMAPAQSVTIDFLTETGRRLKSFSGTTSPGTNNVSMDLSGMANGIYIGRIKVQKQDGKDEIVLKKLAITR